MSAGSFDQTQTTVASDSADSLRLQRRLRLQGIVGILLTLLIAGGIASIQFYQSQRSAAVEQLYKDVTIGSLALNAKLGEFGSITRQVNNPSHIRRFLRQFNQGVIELARLRAETEPILADAMRLSQEIIGITRLDRNLRPVAAVGSAVPPAAWPRNYGELDLAPGLPYEFNGRPIVAFAGAIESHDGERVGTDVIFFDANEPVALGEDLVVQFEFPSQLVFMTREDGETRLFRLDGASADIGLIEDLPAIGRQLFETEGKHYHENLTADGTLQIVLHNPIPETGWEMLFIADARELFATARSGAAHLLVILVLLTIVGIAITHLLTRPTLGRILIGENALRELNARNQDLLTEALNGKRLLDDIVNHSKAVIFIKDLDGRYILVNQAYASERGLPAEEIVGRTDYDFHDGATADMFRANDLATIESGAPIVIEENLRIDEAPHTFLTTKFPLRNHDNEIYAMCGIATDISEIKRNEQLKIDLEAAESANRAKSTFLANMSHELRTPLHGILSFSEIGMNRVESVSAEKLKSYYSNIHISGQRLLKLLNDLLDLSRLEAGKLELSYGECDIEQVIEECLQEQAPAIDEKSLRIGLHDDGVDTRLECDQERIFQVVRNILNNAIKFSPAQGEIDFEMIDSAGHDWLELRVTDDGAGIEPGDRRIIFDKFTQSSNTPNRGTGLGLSICREIVGLHRGEISAENSPGRGATLIVRLPRRRADKPVSAETDVRGKTDGAVAANQ